VQREGERDVFSTSEPRSSAPARVGWRDGTSEPDQPALATASALASARRRHKEFAATSRRSAAWRAGSSRFRGWKSRRFERRSGFLEGCARALRGVPRSSAIIHRRGLQAAARLFVSFPDQGGLPDKAIDSDSTRRGAAASGRDRAGARPPTDKRRVGAKGSRDRHRHHGAHPAQAGRGDDRNSQAARRIEADPARQDFRPGRRGPARGAGDQDAAPGWVSPTDRSAFLFEGPKGVGKTESSPRSRRDMGVGLLRLEMSAYMETALRDVAPDRRVRPGYVVRSGRPADRRRYPSSARWDQGSSPVLNSTASRSKGQS